MYDPSQLYVDPILTNMSVGFGGKPKMAKKQSTQFDVTGAVEAAKAPLEEAPSLPPQNKMMAPDPGLPPHPSDGKHSAKGY